MWLTLLLAISLTNWSISIIKDSSVSGVLLYIINLERCG